MKPSKLPPELETKLGVPKDTITLSDGATAWVWEVDPAGTGIAVARSASAALDGVLMQIAALKTFVADRGLKMRALVVSLALNGNRRFHERPDLIAVETAVQAEPRRCEFVAFTDMSRISRSPMGLLLFCDFLRQNQTELVLASGEKQPPLAMLQTLAAHERSMLRERTVRSVRRRLEDGGMKWLGPPPFGFTTLFAPNPEQWPYVQFIFERIDEAPAGEPLKKTLHRVCNELGQAGVVMREATLRRMISNRIYTGGERSIGFAGEAVTLPPFELPERIPDDVFQRVYARLSKDAEERAKRARSRDDLHDD